MKYEQVADGEWVQVIRRRQKQKCCDCGLVHVVRFRVVNGKLYYQSWRDNRATAAARRKYAK